MEFCIEFIIMYSSEIFQHFIVFWCGFELWFFPIFHVLHTINIKFKIIFWFIYYDIRKVFSVCIFLRYYGIYHFIIYIWVKWLLFEWWKWLLFGCWWRLYWFGTGVVSLHPPILSIFLTLHFQRYRRVHYSL